MSKNHISKEWDNATEGWVDFVRQGKDYFRDELDNPAMFYLIGNVKGRAVLDVACGEGYNTRLLAKKGAKVVGIDLSKKMIESAISQEQEDHYGIDYYVMNSKALTFSAESFDLVTCFMALMDIKDYDKTIKEIVRVLKDNGRFVFSIIHPCFEYDAKNQKLERTSKYFERRSEKISWNMERLRKPFETTSYHRTLTDYSKTLYKCGLLITKINRAKTNRKWVGKISSTKTSLINTAFYNHRSRKK